VECNTEGGLGHKDSCWMIVARSSGIHEQLLTKQPITIE
jgi:hypothetical protein